MRKEQCSIAILNKNLEMVNSINFLKRTLYFLEWLLSSISTLQKYEVHIKRKPVVINLSTFYETKKCRCTRFIHL